MDYTRIKEILQEVSNTENREYPAELDKVIEETAKSGIIRFSWNLVRPLLRARLQRVLDCGFEGQECTDDEGLCDHLLDRLDRFENPPFTIQRVCELIMEPRKHYKKIGAFMRAMERNLLVVSTQEPDLTWMKSLRLNQLIEEPVNRDSWEKLTNSNSDELHPVSNNELSSTPSPHGIPVANRHPGNSAGDNSTETDTAVSNGQEHQMDFESSITRINRKRKSCERDDTDEVVLPARKDEETRTILQEADSTTTVETDREDTAIDTHNIVDLETVAKRLKPSSAEATFPQEPLESGELPEKTLGASVVSSALDDSEQVQNESTGQSELVSNVGSNGQCQ